MKSRPALPPGPYLVAGLARSGRAAALVLRDGGERVIGVDRGEPDELEALAGAGVELHLRDTGVELLDRVGAVVKSPGVPAQAPAIALARSLGLAVIGELELAWRLLPNEFIAVTGTNGKTTTVEWIGHIHREAGLPVTVAGNVGNALSGLVGAIDRDVVVVCEASSFQLEDATQFAPEAAVLLNVTPDHLDRHATFDAYLQAKLRVFACQEADDLAVVPAGFEPRPPGAARLLRFGVRAERAELSERDGMLRWQGEPLLDRGELRLRGRHNLENAMASATVCLARGLDLDAVRAGLRSFAGVPHRLEQVAERGGVVFVNDSKATNVASTLVALETMAEEGSLVHLILGGQGKGQDFTALRTPVSRVCRAVYLIGEDASSIEQAIEGGWRAGERAPATRPPEPPAPEGQMSEGHGSERGAPELHRCGELEQAVAVAAATAKPGEVVLLAPGCASFDQFADFEDRGERFRELVLGL